MKKILTALLALSMLLGCVALFASCGEKPELDLEKAKELLEDEDYSVEYQEDVEIPYYEEMLLAENDEDYIEIIKFADSKSAKYAYEKIKFDYKTEIDSLKLEMKNFEHLLKKYEDDLSDDEYDAMDDRVKDIEDRIEDLEEEFVYGRSGKIVWRGTKDAVKDCRK